MTHPIEYNVNPMSSFSFSFFLVHISIADKVHDLINEGSRDHLITSLLAPRIPEESIENEKKKNRSYLTNLSHYRDRIINLCKIIVEYVANF